MNTTRTLARTIDTIASGFLHLAVVAPGQRPLDEPALERISLAMSELLQPEDSWTYVQPERAAEFDAAIVWAPCGPSPAVSVLCELGVPFLPLSPPLCFHPFHAALEREAEKRSGRLLASHNLAEILGSLQALRALKALQGSRLLLLDEQQQTARGERTNAFAHGLRNSTGITIEHFPVSDLLSRAAAYEDAFVLQTWRQLESDVFEGAGEFHCRSGMAHLLQTTRLYLALRELLEECGACGATVDDISAFLRARHGQFPDGVMPNLTHAALVDAGFLACEEGDIEALASELLLYAAFGEHPTMSNLYLSHRDRFDALESGAAYTPEMQREDFEQCRRENILMTSHFSTAGILPPGMRVESRLAIRETLPSWPGQSMVSSTPRLGPVQLARLGDDGTTVHHFGGDVVDVCLDDSRGWYRGRWFIEIESVDDFISRCLHQHYAIAPRRESDTTSWDMLLRLTGISNLS